MIHISESQVITACDVIELVSEKPVSTRDVDAEMDAEPGCRQ